MRLLVALPLLALALSSPACAGRSRAASEAPGPAAPTMAPPGARQAQPCRPSGAQAADAPPGETYFEFQVTRPVTGLGGPTPIYPAQLLENAVEGEVLVQLVVDVDGCLNPGTMKVLSATNDLFLHAIREVLPYYRFTPAEVEGRKVRQWVQLPFNFSVQ